jgi:hypothetical protein
VTFRPASVAVTETFLGAAGFAKAVEACEGAMDRDAMSAAAMTAATEVLALRARLLSGITSTPCQRMGVNGTFTPYSTYWPPLRRGGAGSAHSGDPAHLNLPRNLHRPYALGVSRPVSAPSHSANAVSKRGVPVGQPTRGTTFPNRLRRVDRWMLHTMRPVLTDYRTPRLIVDLGFGADSVTTVEMFTRLRTLVCDELEVVGIEIDPERVRIARADEQPGLTFRRGGFEIPLDGRDATVVRAFNVLRQYDESEVQQAWDRVVSRLAPGGAFLEGTCDEIGRVASWVTLRKPMLRSIPTQRSSADTVRAVPQTLTFAADVSSLERPGQFAERLPKALIHRNVPGEPIHDLLSTWDHCWVRTAAHSVFGPRQRWIAAIRLLKNEATHVDVLDSERRWRLGELTVSWACVAPRHQ